MNESSNIVETYENQTYEILKKGYLTEMRARHTFDKMKNVKAAEISSLTDLWNPFETYYRIVYKKKD